MVTAVFFWGYFVQVDKIVADLFLGKYVQSAGNVHPMPTQLPGAQLCCTPEVLDIVHTSACLSLS